MPCNASEGRCAHQKYQGRAEHGGVLGMGQPEVIGDDQYRRHRNWGARLGEGVEGWLTGREAAPLHHSLLCM